MPALKLKDKDGNWITLPTIKGADGKDGVDGKSAYQQAVEAGYSGTEAAFYAALVSLKDGPFLPVSGGTMTGDLVLGANGLCLYNLKITAYESEGACWLDIGENGRVGGILTGLDDPWYPNDAANKGYVDSKTLVFSGKTIATTAWVSNSTYSAQGYAYRASVACAGVTTSHRPDVAFSAADAVSGNFAPVAESYGGGVYIYCKTKPTATVTIPSIVCVKGA